MLSRRRQNRDNRAKIDSIAGKYSRKDNPVPSKLLIINTRINDC